MAPLIFLPFALLGMILFMVSFFITSHGSNEHQIKLEKNIRAAGIIIVILTALSAFCYSAYTKTPMHIPINL